MKKNTGCGSNNYGCPPGPKNDVAHSESLFSESEQFAVADTLEDRVVLGDVLIQTLAEAEIHLPTYATDIKHIRKNVRLTQCKALPVAGNPNFVKLFVKGFVHKNIQYAEDGAGVIKDYSVDVPFAAFQQVELASPLVFPFGEFSVKGNVLERREISKDGMGADRCNFGSLTFEVNNEPVKCKLLASAVNQWDILEHFDNWGRFNQITEKMEVILVLKLTQLQQDPGVPFPTIPPTGNGNGDDSDDTAFSSSTGAMSETVYDRFRRIVGGQ
ncbi:CsxC family protein [Radiobacillus sp. PE A8.2]|uniref:CsxC family protein n=1 Tax=Radiobacillus sp. PE A8.2 TaxID=3380349 RepID=UPI003891037E